MDSYTLIWIKKLFIINFMLLVFSSTYRLFMYAFIMCQNKHTSVSTNVTGNQSVQGYMRVIHKSKKKSNEKLAL